MVQSDRALATSYRLTIVTMSTFSTESFKLKVVVSSHIIFDSDLIYTTQLRTKQVVSRKRSR